MTPTELLRQNEQLARALRNLLSAVERTVCGGSGPAQDGAREALSAYAASKSSESGVTEAPAEVPAWAWRQSINRYGVDAEEVEALARELAAAPPTATVQGEKD